MALALGALQLAHGSQGVSPEAADAVKAIAAAVAQGELPRRELLLTLMSEVTQSAESAMRRARMSAFKIRMWWPGMGHIGTEGPQIMDYVRFVVSMQPAPSHVCEIGFNAGHSAALFLAVTPPQTVYQVIDPQGFAYSQSSLDFLDALFPGRIRLYRNLSGSVLGPGKTPSDLQRCELWSLDGGHRLPEVTRDVATVAVESPRTRLILVDDIGDAETHRRA
jgi:hypothetical protein